MLKKIMFSSLLLCTVHAASSNTHVQHGPKPLAQQALKVHLENEIKKAYEKGHTLSKQLNNSKLSGSDREKIGNEIDTVKENIINMENELFELTGKNQPKHPLDRTWRF